MIGVYLFAWVVFPALMLLLCGGAGLLVRRVAGPRFVPPVLTLPVGLALLVVVGGFFCWPAALAPLAGPAFVVVGVVGLVLERDRLTRLIARRARPIDPWPIIAGLGAWALVAAPIVLSGKPGFTGYGRIVDISYELDLAVHFAHSGRHIPAAGTSAYEVVLKKYLGSGYPGGGPWTLGALSNLTPIDLSWLYQPFLAFVSAMSALSLYSLLGRFVENRALRTLGAFVAALPNVLYAYVLTGGVKELSTSCFLLLTAALLVPVTDRMRPGRGLLAVPVAIAATVASFSLTTLPWVGVLCVGTAATLLVLRGGRVAALLACAQVTAVGFVLALPTLAAALKLLPVVNGAGPVDLGNLGAPVPGISAAGVWITGDVRFPQFAHRGPSEALAIVVLVLAAFGLLFAIRRRAWSVAWLGAAGGVALFYVAHRYGPWIQFKADCISSPIAVLLAFAGAGGLIGALKRPRAPTDAQGAKRRLLVRVGPIGRPAALLAVLAVAGAILAGNALLYHDITLSPYARLHNLQQIGERFAGQGPTMTPDFEEYAEYYLRDGDQNSVVNGPTLGLRPEVNRATEPGGIFAYDLDEFTLPWVEGFRTIVMRRDPLASRPPSNYALVYISPYYEVWQRAQPVGAVYAHVHFDDVPADRQPQACAEATAAARKAGAGARIAYTLAPAGYVQVDGSNMTVTGGLTPLGGTIIGNGAGRAVREQPIPVAGTYDFFFSGSFGRPVDVYVDGRHVGTAAYQESYPGGWILIATSRLSAGVHKIEIRRGGVGLHPGNGNALDDFNRTIGPLVIFPARPATPVVHYDSVGALTRLCGSPRRLRWLEIVRPA
ncbi:MAG TPA: hypothetical protein VK707_10410 [Solirubrobacteraceae bacterium]|jgi:hypothetical protein|nr:hypothetical protein [Solirubrobacteraceae bacterium]